jgi:DNA-directed RNA polymerase specialized sigma24 family protein
VTTSETLAVLRLRQWAYDRAQARAGRTAVLAQRGFVERRSRNADARLVRILDFERAFGHLPDEARALLVAIYRDGASQERAADLVGISPRAVNYLLPQARCALAEVLDRADLL